jgi:hypothetical protein
MDILTDQIILKYIISLVLVKNHKSKGKNPKYILGFAVQDNKTTSQVYGIKPLLDMQ